ncbi:MAG: tRNA lysidine(34) synthetase TilS [Elusimicrobiales bacterium]|nr:tRNA lysidine(34) synthetase TilS [Elusimicrobiales bacterium]
MKKITLTIWNKINNFIKCKKLLDVGDRLLLAVSGGPDSMLMLHYFHKTFKGYFAVFHLNHMIRKNSDLDEKLVRNYCEENFIDFVFERVSIKELAYKNKENLENFARKIRYSLYLKYAKRLKCNLVLTAHNYDENVETILLNLFRGTDPDGLFGIPLKRKLGKKIFVVRPLLCLRKMEILNYLKENKIKYIMDETNFDISYSRNWLRHKIIPEIEKRYPGFALRLIEMFDKLKKK